MADLTIPEDLSVPAFLIISAEERKAAWAHKPLTDPYRGGNEEVWRERERERRALIAAEIRTKKAASLARLKEQHEGERYDRKSKTWVKVKEDPDAMAE